jgi:hypothetical protein
MKLPDAESDDLMVCPAGEGKQPIRPARRGFSRLWLGW